MDFKTCIPTGDKIMLSELEGNDVSEGGIILPDADNILTEVVAVGPGIPYGRGEFYAPTAKVGMRAMVKASVWQKADKFRSPGGEMRVRVLHERDISFLIPEA